MALNDPYATRDQLKTYLQIPLSKTSLDDGVDDALASASEEVGKYTGRQFNKAGVVSSRVFQPSSRHRVEVDDFHTTSGLVVETYTGGDSFAALTDFELMPLNGVVEGQPGWPFNEIISRSTFFGEYWDRVGTVRVTADWGWAAVPSAVKQATLILAGQLSKLADAPFGVAGMSEYGVVRVRDIPQVEQLLCKYRRWPVLGG